MKKIDPIFKSAALAACLLAAAHGALQAGAPLKINFQGRLDESGAPAEGSKSFVFKIYDVSSGGTPVWTSAAQSLALSQGVFSASLAAGTPAALSTGTFTGARYVEITVDGVTLSPRQEMVSAPYALVAQALAPDAVIPQGTILAASVTDYHVLLTTGAITSGKFTDDRVYVSTGAFYGGFNGADQLVQMTSATKLPAVDGSLLTGLNPSNLSGAVAAAKGGTGLTAPGSSGNLLRSDGTAWTSWPPNYLASYTETDPAFLAQKGAASGVAPLGANAKINSDYIAGTIVSTHIADASIGTADLASAVFNLGNFTAGMLSTDYLAGTIVSTHIAASGISAAKITSGVFNDNRLAISTGAFAGGFNGADQLVRLDGSGRLGVGGAANSTLSVAGAMSLPIVTITISSLPYTVTGNDSTVLVNMAGVAADKVVNLPDAALVPGRIYTIKRVDFPGAGLLNIVPAAGQTIDGTTPISFASQWDSITIQSTGSDWALIAAVP